MIVSIIALIVLLVCILFIRSTIIIKTRNCISTEEERPAKVNVLFSVVCASLSFIPYVKWALMAVAPILTIIWFCSNGFDDNNERIVEISDKTIIGKILLFKI